MIDVLLARLDYRTEFTILADGTDAAFAAFVSGLQEVDPREIESVCTNRLQRFDLEDF